MKAMNVIKTDKPINQKVRFHAPNPIKYNFIFRKYIANIIQSLQPCRYSYQIKLYVTGSDVHLPSLEINSTIYVSYE